jgi:hypothetical protein
MVIKSDKSPGDRYYQFRGWEQCWGMRESRGWVYGSLINYDGGIAIRECAEINYDTSIVEGTACQWVNDFDSNNRWLYEGDYVKFSYHYQTYIGMVMFDDKTKSYAIQFDDGYPKKRHIKSLLPLHIFSREELTVVGDFKTTPNLLLCDDELDGREREL